MSNEIHDFAGVPVVLSGPSGVGKTTIKEQLLTRFQDLVVSISATTRAPRNGETHGKDYLFLSREEFERGIEEDRFIEWATVHGEYYGTPRGPIEDHLRNGTDVLLVIDIQGGVFVKKLFPQCLLIFLLPPNMDELARRLHERGTDPEEIKALRLNNAREEISFAQFYDYWVVNHHLDETVSRIRSIILADRCRAPRAFDRYHRLGYEWPDIPSAQSHEKA
jgi:guanylate kinase